MYNGTPKPATPPDMQAGDNVTVKVVANDVQSQDIVNRRSALRASLQLQVNAMFIKNLHFQKRRKWANCCLCALPLFFIAILVALQIIINNLLTGSGNFTCPDDPSQASNSQRAWCAIPSPLTYPPLLQIRNSFRSPNAILYTGTNSVALANVMTPSDASIDAQLIAKWATLKPLLYTGLNTACSISSFITASELSTILDTDCATTGDVTDPATGQAPKEFSATQWSLKGKGLTASPSPQIKLIVAKLTSYPGGLDAFAACASKGFSALSNNLLYPYVPQLETQLPLGSFAPLTSRIYEDPAFAPLFLQAQSSNNNFDQGRFGNVAFLASNCSLLSNAAKCYMGTVGVTQGIYSTCFSTNPKNVGSVSDLQSTLYNSYFNRLKGGIDAIKQ